MISFLEVAECLRSVVIFKNEDTGLTQQHLTVTALSQYVAYSKKNKKDMERH